MDFGKCMNRRKEGGVNWERTNEIVFFSKNGVKLIRSTKLGSEYRNTRKQTRRFTL